MDDCELWTGAATPGGYGQATINGRHWLMHRYAATQCFGEIPKGMIVMHLCDTPACINPKHLRIGTASDNQRDSAAKGRNWQSRKTHCPQGHPYSPENTYLSGRGSERQCRTCRQVRMTRVAERRKEERHSIQE